MGQRLVAETRSYFADSVNVRVSGAGSTSLPVASHQNAVLTSVVFMEGWQREQTDTSDEANL
jgi:hypothetical protein